MRRFRTRLSQLLPRGLRLRRQLNRLDRQYRPEVEALEREHGRDSLEVQGLVSEWRMEAGFVEDELENLRTQAILRKAHRLQLPTPPPPYGQEEDENWNRGYTDGRWHLKLAGYSLVRSAIRTEQRERRETRLAWIGPLTGLIAAMTGLLAVIFAFTR